VRFVVIGGNAAGLSAASVAKRRDPSIEAVVLEEGRFASYSACGIPYWIAGDTTGPDRLITVTPEEARGERGIDLRLGWRAQRVDAGGRAVTAVDPDGRRHDISYDALLLATGSEPQAPFALEPLEGVFAIRHLIDGEAVLRHLAQREPRRAVVVGGGYVALETAEALLRRGLDVTLVMRRRRMLSDTLHDGMSERVLREVERRGAKVLVALAEGVVGDGQVRAVRTMAGDVPADLVVLATGVRARVGLARDAGCRIHDSGAILVDRGMRTSVPGVYAAGDCATVWHRLLQRHVFLPLALHANRGGRVAGENVSGGDAQAPGTIGTAITRFFDLEAARTGLTAIDAAAAGFDAVVSGIEDNTIAGYMPGKSTMRVELVVERGTGRLLGGQVVGGPGAGKRIDAIATAIHAGLTAREVEDVDLAYAPPFSPSYDPVLIAARMAQKKAGQGPP
jgi:NADPH-dependent 2,4-dienoyl-CoA reductase/sulfur reductase-like enzyme